MSNEAKSLGEQIKAVLDTGATGAPPGLLQDDCRGLSKALSAKPNAKQEVRDVCSEISAAMASSPTGGGE